MSRIAVVPGSFDPVTLGHLDVIGRAARIFDELHVLVVHNPDKTALLPIAQRVSLIQDSIADAKVGDNILVTSWSVGLLVDYCTDVGASVLVKGIRSQVDVAYETPMAIVNRNLAGVETIFMLPDPAHAHVSSSLVRQVAALGGDVAPYVPKVVAAFLQKDRAKPSSARHRYSRARSRRCTGFFDSSLTGLRFSASPGGGSSQNSTPRRRIRQPLLCTIMWWCRHSSTPLLTSVAAAMPLPFVGVMRLGPRGWSIASGDRAPAPDRGEHDPLLLGEESLRATQVERPTAVVEQDRQVSVGARTTLDAGDRDRRASDPRGVRHPRDGRGRRAVTWTRTPGLRVPNTRPSSAAAGDAHHLDQRVQSELLGGARVVDDRLGASLLGRVDEARSAAAGCRDQVDRVGDESRRLGVEQSRRCGSCRRAAA